MIGAYLQSWKVFLGQSMYTITYTCKERGKDIKVIWAISDLQAKTEFYKWSSAVGLTNCVINKVS